MTIRFTARVAGVEEEADDCLTVGVAEGEDGAGMVLLFMCGLFEPDEQDIELGMDTYCLVTAGQGTAYGVVEEVTLRERLLRVKVAADSLDALGLDDHEIEASLAVEDDVIDQLRDGLLRVLTYGRPEACPSVLEL
ncbi:Imm10 family immunity protein [Nonomuraea sp. NPDC003707]